MATYSRILAWRIPRTEKPRGLQVTGSQRVGHDWGTNATRSPAADSLCLDMAPGSRGWKVPAEKNAIFSILYIQKANLRICPVSDPEIHKDTEYHWVETYTHTCVCTHTHTHTHSSSTFLQTSDLGHWQAGIVNTYVLCVQCKRNLNLKHKIDLKRVCAQSCPALCDPMDCSPQGSSVCGNFQARILERVAVSFSSGSSALRDWTRVSCVTCMAGGFFTTEPPGNVGREVNTGKDRSLVIKPTKTPRNENPCN